MESSLKRLAAKQRRFLLEEQQKKTLEILLYFNNLKTHMHILLNSVRSARSDLQNEASILNVNEEIPIKMAR